jgi:hypothetical protein
MDSYNYSLAIPPFGRARGPGGQVLSAWLDNLQKPLKTRVFWEQGSQQQ